MDKRQEKLLNLVIESYIETAEPVGSRFLLSESGLDCGEATVRNELRALEEAGFLTHPHTSAGRIPTEKGYRFYLSQADFSKVNISKKDLENLKKMVSGLVGDEKVKTLAKGLAELSDVAVVVSFGLDRVYYTGLSNLFRQPEFKELNLVMNVSAMFDRCEECLEKFYEKVGITPEFFLGGDHPFGTALSVISCHLDNGLIALIGPMRMNYRRNFSLMKEIKNILK